MTYFKSLLFNFLAVFFVNHIIPGVELAYYTKLPEIKGDLIFSFCLGFINSLVFPIYHYFKMRPSHFKIGVTTFFISFGAYSILNILPFGIKITSAGSYIWTSLIVWFAAYFTNHLEYRAFLKKRDKEAEKKEKENEEEESK